MTSPSLMQVDPTGSPRALSHDVPTVRAESLYVTFTAGEVRVPALRGLDLVVGRGEFLAITGASGCGKSTLLNVLGGLLTPTAGRILIDGNDLGRLSDDELTELRRRHIGFVFQRYNLLPALTVEENLGVAAWIRSDESAAALERRREILRMLGLEGRTEHRPSRLSGGEQQRVALARALIGEPALLLADEPTGNLDTESSRVVLELLRRVNEELGQTIIMITHDHEAADWATRRLRMRDGRLHA